eukprot:m.308505 g.308505  ORF g.308505 m.308505 type:complete len:393 (+) comp44135_c0_seq1:74-1252(+)
MLQLLGSRLVSRFCRNFSVASKSLNAFPNVFTSPAIPGQATAAASGPAKLGQLSQSQLDAFFRDGHLITPEFFRKEELEPVMDAIDECVDRLAEKLYRGKKISDRCRGAGFYQRLILLDKQYPGAAVLLHKMGYLPEAFRTLWADERLLNVVEQIIGPNIAGHPVWNLRPKTPHNEQATVPWHQDTAYLEKTCWNTMQVTAWIPLLDTNTQNGCMQVIRGGHRLGKTATHTCCSGGSWYVDLDVKEMEKTLDIDYERDIVTCEIPLGGVLWLNNVIPHRSLENYSDQVRWSLDLRWQDPNKPSGFWSIKDMVIMRKAGDPDYTVNWTKFANEDRTKLQMAEMGKMDSAARDNPFDTTIAGPWMNMWELTHHNKHTKAFLRGNQNDIRGWHKA